MYALETKQKFPIDTIEDVVKAEKYFLDYEDQFPLEQKREYCKNLASQQENFSLDPHEKIATYASEDIDESKLKAAISARSVLVEKTAENDSALDKMKDYIGNIETLIKKMTSFDRKNRLDELWDGSLPNPIVSIVCIKKKKPEPELYGDGTDFVSGDAIRNLRWYRELLKDKFSDNFINRFMRSPIHSFKNLPKHEKKILMNIAKTVDNELGKF